MKIHAAFDQIKAAQVSAKLINLGGQTSMDKMKLVKLLYLVDRQAFQEKGRPIIGGTYVSMPHGPVISQVLDSMNFGDQAGWGLWEKHFRSEGPHSISLESDPGDDALSRRDLKIINEVFEAHGRKSTFELRDFTHTLPEWEDPEGSSIEIPLERLLLATGRTLEDAKRILMEMDGVQFLSAPAW